MDINNNVWIVNKFGGLSVGSYLDRIPNIINAQLNKEFKVALVCSARSSIPHSTKSTTSRLLKLMEINEERPWDAIIKEAEEIFEEHRKEIKSNIKDVNLLEKLLQEIDEEYKRLIFLLEALQVIGEASFKTLDLIVSVGERLSCLLITTLLKDRGIDVCYIDLNKVIPNTLKEADYNLISQMLAENVKNQVPENCKVAIMGGFMGTFPGGLLNTVGRGYSDITASCLSVALKACELIVWKHIDGIYTANPNLVEDARLLQLVTVEEAYELTYYGTEALHPLAIEISSKDNISIRIRNIQVDPNIEAGTVISSNQYTKDKLEDGVATAVCIKEDVVVLNVQSNRKSRSHNFLRNVFSILNKYLLIADLVSTSEVNLSMALSKPNYTQLNTAVNELNDFGSVQLIKDLVIISLIGRNMNNRPGVAKDFFRALSSAGANIEMISQGSSEINISGVISSPNAQLALQAIHRQLLTSSSPKIDIERILIP